MSNQNVSETFQAFLASFIFFYVPLENNYFTVVLPVLGSQVIKYPLFLSYFDQVVMTIVVAFILEAFRFRIKYRQEHLADEEGEELQILL